jgi:mono/diheme cytochrome c family protein
MNRFVWLSVGVMALGIAYFSLKSSKDGIDYNTQVKPLLNKHCIACHGGVKRESNFSLLFRSEAVAIAKSGKPAIVPFHPEKSEFIHRLTLSDPQERMPYKADPLSKEEIAILTQWVKEGAQWGDHWAYKPVEVVSVPKKWSISGLFNWFSSWEKNDIDYFVKEQLEENDLEPSKEADPGTLLRRVSLDLTGLPPSAALQERFLKDPSDENYQKIVEELLASPAYGERWAAMWMDVARYSDTKGYERDDSRTIWKYRDWLIKAFNKDMPYNQFLTEQLAGDLLPNPTEDQLVATAFHRNTMTNDEGGTDNEEFRTSAVFDRVNTTWEVLQSTTFACVQCHSHPYDPFRHEEYYKYLAFFNNTRDEDTHADYPLYRHYSATHKLKLDSLEKSIARLSPSKVKETSMFLKTLEPHINSLVADKASQGDLIDSKILGLRYNGVARIPSVDLTNKTHYLCKIFAPEYGSTLEMHLDSPDGKILTKIPIDTAGIGKFWKYSHRIYPITNPTSGVHDIYFVLKNPSLKNKPDNYGIVWDWMKFTDGFIATQLSKDKVAYQQFWDLLNATPETVTPIMIDNPSEMARKTHVFERGNWLVKGALVQPDVPNSLGGMPKGLPRNRLGLAQWMTSPQNPLTARTMVNRFWEQIFGIGLVETLEDFGTQGFSPSHPQLLDYLAHRFANDWGWSPKRLLKEIVLSAAYRQDSKVSAELWEKDPANRFLARGPRIRLSAEQVRDQALALSGLLSKKMYGPSVMPPQPDGVWASPWNGKDWKTAENEDRYRRALYTYWKRTSPYPAMMMFDGASREVCVARRIRTNTPLQALVTLNDPAYLEVARQMSDLMSKEKIVGEQIGKTYRQAIGRDIGEAKLAVLEKLYDKSLKMYQQNPKEAAKLLACDAKKTTPEKAALTVVANAMLNLDEFITKE